jgi:hypothetical protein
VLRERSYLRGGSDAVPVLQLNPVLIALSYYNAWKAGRVNTVPDTPEAAGAKHEATARVLSHVQFKMQDFWCVPLNTFDVITVFGVRSIMARLEEKVALEARSELHVVCYRFPLPNKKPVYNHDELFIYRFSPDDPPLQRKQLDGEQHDHDRVASLFRKSS